MEQDRDKSFTMISRRSFSERVKSSFFETICFIGIPPAEKESPRMAVFRLFLIEVRWFLQLLPYLEEEERKDNGTVVKNFWFAVSCIRPDMIMSYLQAAWVWLILVWVGVAACWLLFAFVFYFTFSNRGTHPRVRKLLQIFGQLLLSLISVPSANILLSTWFPDSRFGNGISPSMRQWAGGISLLIYCGLVAFQSTMILATFEYDITQKGLRGKNEVDHDFITLLVAQTTMLSYYSLYNQNRMIHYLTTFAISASLAVRCYWHLPYYRSLANAVTFWSRSSLAGCAFAFIIGEQVSPLCSMMLVIAVTVSAAVVVWLGFDEYQAKTLSHCARHIHSQLADYQFDLGIRYYLFRALKETDQGLRMSLCRSVIEKIDTLLKVSIHEDKKRLTLVKYIIYLNLIKDERAARVALSQAMMQRSSITSSFIEFKAKWMLTASSDLEEIRFLQYLENLENIKSEDRVVCQQLNELWSELGSHAPDVSRVVRLSTEVNSGISYLKREFKNLIKNFPRGFESYNLYGSFVSDVLGREEEGKRWISKAASLNEQRKRKEEKEDSEETSFFDPEAGVILAEVGDHDFGSIIFVSERAAEYLEFKSKGISYGKIHSIIPPPYCDLHLRSIRRFIQNAESTLIAHPDTIPLLNAKGYILFCTVKMYITSNGNSPIIAIAFKPINSLREGAIIAENWIIEAYSERFGKFIGYDGVPLQGADLSRLHPNLTIHRSKSGTSSSFRIFSNHAYCGVFTSATFASRTLYFFYVFKSGIVHADKECTKWDYATYEYKASYLFSSAPRSDAKPTMFFQSVELERKDTRRILLAEEENGGSFSYNKSLVTPKLISRSSNFLSSSIDRRTDVNELARRINVLFRWSASMALGIVRHRQLLALVALNISVLVVLGKDLRGVIEHMSVGDIVVKEIYASQITVNARSYHFNIQPRLNPMFQQSLSDFTLLLEGAHQHIWNDIDLTQSAEFAEFNMEKRVDTWELLDGEIKVHPRSLIDAVGAFIDMVNSNIFYVFRNGVGETMRKMETARNMFADNEAWRMNEAIRNYYLFPLIGVLILLAFAVLLIPLLLGMLKSGAILSKLLLDNPVTFFFEQKRKVVDRLQERYGVEVEYSIDKAFRGTRAVVRFTNPLRTNAVAVGVFVLLSSLFYCLLYFQMFLSLTNTLQLAPTMVNSYSEYMASLSEAYVWAMENRYYTSPLSIKQFIPEYSLVASPIIIENRAIAQMDSTINKVMKEYLNGYPLLEWHFDFLYRSVDSPTLYLKRGMRAAAKALKWDLQLCMNADSSICTGLMANVYSVQTTLANNSLEYINYFKTDSKTAAFQQIETIEVAIASFTVALVVYILLYVLVVNQREYRRTKTMWKLCTLLPEKPSGTTGLPQTIAKRDSISISNSFATRAAPTFPRPKASLNA